MKKEIIQLIADIEDIENDDSTLEQLEQGMEYFCSTWDKCEGYKHAIIKCIEDQYTHHESEQEPEDIEKLKAILKLK